MAKKVVHILSFVLTVKEPTMENLTLIWWKDDSNETQKLEIISRIRNEFQRAALQLGQTMNDVDGYLRMSNNDTMECCNRIFTRWINNDGYAPTYPKTWEGVCRLLYALGMCGVEDELIKALASHEIEVRKQCRQ